MLIGTFIICGIILGLLTFYMFILCESKWVSQTLAVAINSGFFPLYSKVVSEFKVADSNGINLLFAYLLSLLLAFLACFIIVAIALRSKSETEVSFMDILIGQKAAIKTHLKRRQSLIDQHLNVQDIDKKIAKLEAKEKWISGKTSNLEQILSEFRKNPNGINFAYPLDKIHPISQRLVNSLPSYHARIDKTFFEVRSCMGQYIERISNDEEDFGVFIHAFLKHLASSVCNHLFHGTDTNIRVHFRVLTKDAEGNLIYKKLLAQCAEKNSYYENKLTSIPFNKSLISQSWKFKQSLVASLYAGNEEHVFEGDNHHLWKEFITLTFPEFSYRQHPIITMGVSSTEFEGHGELMMYLSHIKFEIHVQRVIKEFYEKIITRTSITKEQLEEFYVKEFAA